MSKKRILSDGARRLGLRAGKKELALLDLYTRELLEASKRFNLTGHRDPESIEVFHYLDSLSLFQTGLIRPGLRVLDVGSGAGFPGLPLKIFEPGLDLTLAESSEKRGNFLRHIVRTLGLEGVRVEIARAEELQAAGAGPFDGILCRAVSSMIKVCSWTGGMLSPGGAFLFQKSRRVDREIAEMGGVLSKLALEEAEVQPLTVPYLERPRYAVIIRKKRS